MDSSTRSARLVPAVLATVLAGLLATSAWLWWGDRAELDQSATAVARQQVVNFFSLDHRHVDADLDRVLALSTGRFRQQYSDQRKRVAKGVRNQKLSVTAVVPDNGAALEYQHGNRAQVLVGVDVTSKKPGAESKTNRYRVRLELQRIDSQWLVAKINQAG